MDIVHAAKHRFVRRFLSDPTDVVRDPPSENVLLRESQRDQSGERALRFRRCGSQQAKPSAFRPADERDPRNLSLSDPPGEFTKIIHNVGLTQDRLACEAFEIMFGIEAINVVPGSRHDLCNIDSVSMPSSVSRNEQYRSDQSAMRGGEINIARSTPNPSGLPSPRVGGALFGPRTKPQTADTHTQNAH